jgi:hypothetical protein
VARRGWRDHQQAATQELVFVLVRGQPAVRHACYEADTTPPRVIPSTAREETEGSGISNRSSTSNCRPVQIHTSLLTRRSAEGRRKTGREEERGRWQEEQRSSLPPHPLVCCCPTHIVHVVAVYSRTSDGCWLRRKGALQAADERFIYECC